jgi:hypothetical protein
MSRWQLSNKLCRLPRARKGARWRILALFGPRAIRGAGPRYPDERTSYLSNAAGLHRAKIVGRHCVDSPPRALHRRMVLRFPATN